MDDEFGPIFELKIGSESSLGEWVAKAHPMPLKYPELRIRENLRPEDYQAIVILLREIAGAIEKDQTPDRRDLG